MFGLRTTKAKSSDKQAKDTTHINLPLTKIRFGFTLAEVLITLGIIGVVAAITIPNLMTAYKAKKMRSQFLKSYSVIQQAFRQMEVDDVSTDISTYSGKMGSFYDAFKTRFNGAHWCGYYNNTSSTLPCAKDPTYKTLNGRHTLDKNLFDDGQFVLPDGTLVIIENPNTSDVGRVWIFVDLNGYGNPPNRLGYDLFVFQFVEGELHTMGDLQTSYTDVDKYCNLKSSDIFNGIACAQKAKENSDYFYWVVKNVK